MKVGTEEKKKLIAMVILLAVFVFVLLYNFKDQIFGSASAANVPAAPVAAPQSQSKTGPSGSARDTTDPSLRLDVLEASRRVKYEAGGRNIFRMEAAPIKPTLLPVRGRDPIGPPFPPTPTPPPPPPPIPITYYGYAKGEPRRVFLQKQGEGDVFVAREGDIVARRYKIVEIQPTSITMEDVITNNRQSIKLTVK